jgi:antitoxin (DNA-binding transcriptional repressor) of toxin-antitoxin stability system
MLPLHSLTLLLGRRYNVSMKTLTITEARKNLSHWLAAAAGGDDVGIILGANIIALRKVEVESADLAQREYGATSEQVAALQAAVDNRYHRLRRSGKLRTVPVDELRGLLEEASFP